MSTQLSEPAGDQGTQPDGSEDLGWRAALPDDLKNHEMIKDYAKPGDAIQDFVKLKQETDSMVKIPGEDATDEDRAAFLDKLGRPGTADDYTITKPENLPEGVQYDENTEKVFKDVFYEIGLPDDKANVLWNKYHEMVVQGHEMQEKAEGEALETAVNELKDEWPGDKFKENTEIAHRAFSNIFEDAELQGKAKEFVENTKINGLSLGDHPMFLKVFHKIGSIIGDDNINLGRGDGIQGGGTEEDKAKNRFPNTKFD